MKQHGYWNGVFLITSVFSISFHSYGFFAVQLTHIDICVVVGTIASEKDVPSPHELSGAATADVVMVLEFLHTFKNAIFIGG